MTEKKVHKVEVVEGYDTHEIPGPPGKVFVVGPVDNSISDKVIDIPNEFSSWIIQESVKLFMEKNLLVDGQELVVGQMYIGIRLAPELNDECLGKITYHDGPVNTKAVH